MSVTLSIKNASDEVVERLRSRAARNHRSLQGELMSIIEAAAREPEHLSPAEVYERARARGLHAANESAAMVRADRDGH